MLKIGVWACRQMESGLALGAELVGFFYEYDIDEIELWHHGGHWCLKKSGEQCWYRGKNDTEWKSGLPPGMKPQERHGLFDQDRKKRQLSHQAPSLMTTFVPVGSSSVHQMKHKLSQERYASPKQRDVADPNRSLQLFAPLGLLQVVQWHNMSQAPLKA